MRTTANRLAKMRVAIKAETLESRRLLSAGAFDPIFGMTDGQGAQRDFIGQSPAAVSLQPNGKFIVVGQDGDLRRFNSNGSIDRGFGVNDIAKIPAISDSVASATVAAPLSSGKIIVGGTFAGGYFVSRLRASGTLDRSFGSAGIVIVPINLTSIAVQKDQKIVVYGSATDGSGQVEMTRLLSTGKVDSKFGNAGVMLTTFPDLGAGTTPTTVALLANGGIVAAGEQVDQGPQSFDPVQSERGVLARFKTDGALDPAFGVNGIDLLPTISTDNTAVSAQVAVESDGTSVIVYDGSTYGGGSIPVSVSRFLPNGTLDSSFGDSGIVNLLNAPFGAGYHAIVRPDQEIAIIGGNEGPISIGSISLTLLESNGTIDTRFGTVGTQPSSGTSQQNLTGIIPVNAVEQRDGKIVILGGQALGGGGGALARYTTVGNLDASFGYDGVVIDSLGISGPINATAVQKDAKILIAGSELAPASNFPTEAALARYKSDGTLDTTFGNKGRIFVQIGDNASFGAAAIAPNGDILVSATGDSGASGQTAATPLYFVYCFRANGSLDKRFGVRGAIMSANPISALSVLSDGTIAAAAEVSEPSVTGFQGTPLSVLVSQYLPNGRPNLRFGSAGQVDVNTAGNVTNLFVEADGKLLVGSGGSVVRLNSDGSVDTSFGTLGFVGAGYDAMALAPNGDIVTASQSYLTRYLPDGQLDQSFGDAGVLGLATAFGSLSVETIMSAAVDANGQVLLGVSVFNTFTTILGVARLSYQGLDVGFGSDGVTDFGTFQSPYYATIPAITVQPDGSILATANGPGGVGSVDIPAGLFRLTGT